jgi:hypothetical protein
MKICVAVSAPAIPPMKILVPAGNINLPSVAAVAPSGRVRAILAETGEEICDTVSAVVRKRPTGADTPPEYLYATIDYCSTVDVYSPSAKVDAISGESAAALSAA